MDLKLNLNGQYLGHLNELVEVGEGVGRSPRGVGGAHCGRDAGGAARRVFDGQLEFVRCSGRAQRTLENHVRFAHRVLHRALELPHRNQLLTCTLNEFFLANFEEFLLNFNGVFFFFFF